MTSPARLKRHLDQKTSVFNFTFGIIAALSGGAVQTRDDGRYTQSPLKPCLTASEPVRDRVVRLLMVLLFRARAGTFQGVEHLSATRAGLREGWS
jgi:hypothetical protein